MMNISPVDLLMPLIGLILGIVSGILFYHLKLKQTKGSIKSILSNAEKEAEKIKKDQLFNLKIELQQRRSRFQNELRQKEDKVSRMEVNLQRREKDLIKEENKLKILQNRIDDKEKKFNEQEQILFEKQKKLDSIIDEQNR